MGLFLCSTLYVHHAAYAYYSKVASLPHHSVYRYVNHCRYNVSENALNTLLVVTRL